MPDVAYIDTAAPTKVSPESVDTPVTLKVFVVEPALTINPDLAVINPTESTLVTS